MNPPDATPAQARPAQTIQLQRLLTLPAAAVIPLALREQLLTAAPEHLTGRDPEPVLADTLDALGRLDADADTLLAALLHGLPGLQQALGAEFATAHPAIASLLDSQHSAARVWQLHAEHRQGRSAEGLRRLLLAIVRDLRVVPILLARQLARLRHAANLPESEQRALAQLTRDIHAPLANRLGIGKLKWELEDLAFRYLQPATYHSIARLLDEKRSDRERHIKLVLAALREALAAQGLHARVDGRVKHIYSIWKKMQKKNVPISELYDLRAVRIQVDDVAACYAALGVVHTLWAPIPSEFDDYIARPKRNDYRSLHTAVQGPEGKTVEVQVRSFDMHSQAELGVAAHWKYKEGTRRADAALDRRVAWMRQLLEAPRDDTGGDDESALLDEIDSELVEDRIYALTPRGEVVDLPVGATVLDFAYRVHTEVGHRCRGAKVDGRIVPLDHKLQIGDRVEILTAKTAEPRRDWLQASNGFLASRHARTKVRNWFNRLERTRNLQAGRELLERELRRLGLLQAELAPARERFRAADNDELYVMLALGDVGPHQVGRLLLELERGRAPVRDAGPEPAPASKQRLRKSRKASEMTVQGVDNLLTQLARCCQPLPGEAIAGYLTRGRGVSVHRADCPTLQRLVASQPQRKLPVDWGEHGAGHEVDIMLSGLDRKHLLKDVTDTIALVDAHVGAIHSDPDRKRGRMRLHMRLRVDDFGQLSALLGKLASLPGVEEARRA